jgi:hypothetical protein
MKYCHTCGFASEDFVPTCPECGADSGAQQSAAKCVPAHVPVAGYMSLDQLDQLAQRVRNDAIMERPVEQVVSAPTDWFATSMSLVKWTGIIATCLAATFFLTVFLKAFI